MILGDGVASARLRAIAKHRAMKQGSRPPEATWAGLWDLTRMLDPLRKSPSRSGCTRAGARGSGYTPRVDAPIDQAMRQRDGRLSNDKTMVCRLRYEGQTADQDRVFQLGDEPLTLGRSSESDLVLNQESVSRAHAQFSRDAESWRIRDLDSKNGIRVNTFRVTEQKLQDGDRIDLGTTRLHVEIRESPPHTVQANVVFSKQEEPGLHTQVFEMSGLTSLLGSSDRSRSRPVQNASASISENLSQVSESSSPNQAAQLLRLVSEAAETLISCDSLDQTLERILALVFNNLPAERGVICLHDEAAGKTQPKVMRTRDGVPDQPIMISSNIANHVIKRKQALLVKDTLMDERFGSAESVIMRAIHSAMCAPLYGEGHAAGVIDVD